MYPVLILPVCLAHWLAMLAWLILQGHQTCSNQCEEALFVLVVAFIYIFTFFNIRDEPTRYKYLIFYSICFLENTALLFIWFLPPTLKATGNEDIFWLRVAGIVGDYALFFIGLISMVLYYVYFHPSLSRRDSKTLEFEKEAGVVIPGEQNRTRSEFLMRKGSLDQTTTPLSLSNPSSRRNVTFAMDFKTPVQKPVRRSSCGDPLDSPSTTHKGFPTENQLGMNPGASGSSSTPTILEKSILSVKKQETTKL